MNTAGRAHRIFRAVANFQKFDGDGGPAPRFQSEVLGDIVGFYRNTGQGAPVIEIYSKGMAWRQEGGVTTVFYNELLKVALGDGKQSAALVLTLRNGKEASVPVNGVQGNFFDSLSMLRFLDRVMSNEAEVSAD